MMITLDTKKPLPVTRLSAVRNNTRSSNTSGPALPTQYLIVDGGRIGYDDTTGVGPIVLAMPGMGDLRSEYRYLRPALVAAGYRVITMDVRGFGDTDAHWPEYTARAVGGDAVKMIEQLGAGPAVILGNSFAAGSALWAAHDAPGKVRRVVLLGPVTRDLPVSWVAKIAMKLGLAGPWGVWFWMTYWNSLFKTRKPVDHNEISAALSRSLKEPGRVEALREMIFASKADTEFILRDNLIPALVVMGTCDPDFSDAEAEARWLSSRLNATNVMVTGAGHYPHTEMPDLVVPSLLSFIARLLDEASVPAAEERQLEKGPSKFVDMALAVSRREHNARDSAFYSNWYGG